MDEIKKYEIYNQYYDIPVISTQQSRKLMRTSKRVRSLLKPKNFNCAINIFHFHKVLSKILQLTLYQQKHVQCQPYRPV